MKKKLNKLDISQGRIIKNAELLILRGGYNKVCDAHGSCDGTDTCLTIRQTQGHCKKEPSLGLCACYED